MILMTIDRTPHCLRIMIPEASKTRQAPGAVVVHDVVDTGSVVLVGDELESQLADLRVGNLLIGERNQLTVHPGSDEVAGLDMDVTGPIRNRLLEHLIHERRTVGNSRSSQTTRLLKVVDSEGGTPTDSHTATSLGQRLPRDRSRAIGSSLQRTKHFGGVCSKIFGTLSEGSEFPHEAVG
jgi:hypothetical protein